MAENTKIAWTHHTFCPWWGCQRVSPGCEACYAETFSKRLGRDLWGPSAPRRLASEATWREPLKWNARAAASGQRERVFCASMADAFEARPELAEPRARLFRLIEATPALDWLLLTKRPEHMVDLAREAGWSGAWPENVWAGTTVEDQKRAAQRIPHLIRVPARVRFLSCEPLLERIDLVCIQTGPVAINPLQREIRWVIVGGESGHDARRFHLDWARAIRLQCRYAGAAFFCKQLGARPVTDLAQDEAWPGHSYGQGPVQFNGDGFGNYDVRGLKDRAGADPAEWPADLRVQEFPGG